MDYTNTIPETLPLRCHLLPPDEKHEASKWCICKPWQIPGTQQWVHVSNRGLEPIVGLLPIEVYLN